MCSTRKKSALQKSCSHLSFIWHYHVVYFFKTLCRPNPDSCTGYELYLFDRILHRNIPLTYGSARIGKVQKIFIVGQVIGCIYMAVECYMFHVASLRYVHDSIYTLWELTTWVQFPIFMFFHLLSAKFKSTDDSWMLMVRFIVAALLLMTCAVLVCTILFIPSFPVGLMDYAWNQDKQELEKPEHRPAWIMNMQRPLECCGYREPNDWVMGKSKVFPYTCCPITTYKRNCSLKYSFPNGCLWKVKHYYETCRPLILTWCVINAAVVIINYGLFRYLFTRNSQGWQKNITWRETLLPVLKSSETPQLPTKMKQPPPQVIRMTESEALMDALSKLEALVEAEATGANVETA